ncbi:HNH endonuclease [Candidatus Woesearchaeota archaeon]|nr:HNH endonuclease [Candidatus Woesearchaeota archaeon]
MAKWFINKKGYRRFSDSGNSVHRWVAGKKLGRPLRTEERVHHINRDKLDNRPSNLWVFKNQTEHTKAHRRDKKRYGFW